MQDSMKRKFNSTGLCVPQKHYMVDLESRLKEIQAMVDDGAYFTINKARQYGKTTILRALEEFLKKDYLVVSLDFQALGNASFQDENTFSETFAEYFLRELQWLEPEDTQTMKEAENYLQSTIREKKEKFVLFDLFDCLIRICRAAPKPLVLIIDEVDSATNNQVFSDFLAQMRNYYLMRDTGKVVTFQSVILAGLYDIRNIKRKKSPWNTHAGNEENGSVLTFDDCPWDYREPVPYNIAADFLVDMSFSAEDIAGMLEQYEDDYHTGMDIQKISGLLYSYTSGYPFLVSRLCKLMDEQIAGSPEFPDKRSAWTGEGFQAAVKLLLNEKNTLFDSLMGKLQDYPELNTMLRSLLFAGRSIAYNADESAIDMASMFGFIKNQHGTVAIANRIFEMRLYNLYLSSAEMQGLDLYKASLLDKNQFIVDGHLNMRLILEKFVLHFHDRYGDSGDEFVEDEGRKYFLLYLRPIINGTGNYYIEAQTRSLGRTDVIVDYRGEQYVIEMKIWRGNEYNTRGEDQLVGYLEDYHIEKGYMLSFNFNKKKQIGVFERIIGKKILVEAVV